MWGWLGESVLLGARSSGGWRAEASVALQPLGALTGCAGASRAMPESQLLAAQGRNGAGTWRAEAARAHQGRRLGRSAWQGGSGSLHVLPHCRPITHIFFNLSPL